MQYTLLMPDKCCEKDTHSLIAFNIKSTLCTLDKNGVQVHDKRIIYTTNGNTFDRIKNIDHQNLNAFKSA